MHFEFDLNDAFNMFNSFFGGEGGGSHSFHTGGGMGGGFPGGAGGSGGFHGRRPRQRPPAELYSAGDGVVELNRRNWKSYVPRSARHNNVWLLEFYSPACRHCRKLAPGIKKLAQGMKGIVRVGVVNCDAQESICEGQDIQELPTLRILAPGGSELYKGRNSAAEIRKALLEALPDTVRVLSNTKDDTLARVSKGGKCDGGCVILVSSHAEPRPLLRAVAGDYAEGGTRKPRGTWKPIFLQVHADQAALDNKAGIVGKLNVTAQPKLLLFRPATEPGAALKDKDWGLSVLSVYSGKAGSAAGIRKWLLSAGKSFPADVKRAQVKAKKARSPKPANPSVRATPAPGSKPLPPVKVASFIDLLECLTPTKNEEKLCVVLVGSTLAQGKTFARSADAIHNSLTAATGRLLKVDRTVVLRQDVAAPIAAKWRGEDVQAKAWMLLLALLDKAAPRTLPLEPALGELARDALLAKKQVKAARQLPGMFGSFSDVLLDGNSNTAKATFLSAYKRLLQEKGDAAAEELPSLVFVRRGKSGSLRMGAMTGGEVIDAGKGIAAIHDSTASNAKASDGLGNAPVVVVAEGVSSAVQQAWLGDVQMGLLSKADVELARSVLTKALRKLGKESRKATPKPAVTPPLRREL